jgi:magnesium transporter
MEDLDIFEQLSLFKSLDEQVQRKVFADLATQEKNDLIDQMDDREAVSLIENIPADEATDLLLSLPKDKTRQLMRLMETKTSKELRKLLGFAKDSAGGLMTTEYLSLKDDALVKDALSLIKENVSYPGNIYHIYLVDDKHHLLGSTSLRYFINEDPDTAIIATCYSPKVFVYTDDGMEEIALLLEKYKFSSIPVLDEEEVLQGVITSDDVMEELIALAWSKYKDKLI